MASINPTTLRTPSETYTGKKCYLKLHITKITQSDGATNKTYIDWKITLEGTPWVTLYRAYCTLGGKVLYDAKPEKSNWSAGQTLASGTNVEFSNNSDGSLTLKAYLKQQYYYGNGDSSRWNNSYYYQDASADMVCSKIARYFSSTPSMTFKDKTETQIRYNWSTPETCDNITLDGSGTKSITGLPGTSGVITITGLSANTSYSHTGTFRRQDSQLTSNSAKQTNSTYNWPQISAVSVADLEIGKEQSLTLYNPLSRSVTIKMKKDSGSGTELYSGSSSTTSIKFTPNSDTLYNSIPSAKSGKAVYQCIYGSTNTNTTTGSYTYKIKGTEVPTFADTNITNVVDTLHVNDITGLNTKIIKGHNKVTGTIVPMVANNKASGKRYIVSANANPSSQEISYATTNKTFSFENITVDSFTVTAYDTRELSTARNKSIDLVDYTKPKVNNFTITRQNGIGEYAVLNADGTNTYWNGWSQIKKYNTIQKVYYRYKPSGSSTWSIDWTDITASLTTNTNGNWRLSKTLDIVFTTTTKYDFQIYVQDVLESSDVKSNTLSTANGFLWRDLLHKWLGINKKPTCELDVNGDINADGNIKSSKTVYATDGFKTENIGIFERGIQGKNLYNGSGTSGYMYAFDVTTTGNYQNQYFTFDVLQRGRKGTVSIYLKNNGTNGIVEVNYVKKIGSIKVYYLCTNNVLSIYIEKSESYDNIEILNFKKGNYMNKTKIDWKHQTVTSLPSGYATAENDQDYTPSHASSSNTFGLGSTSNYGHVKTINNITTSSHSDGNALSAYQGKVLADLIGGYLKIIETGSANNGVYFKFNNGYMLTLQYYEVSIKSYGAWGNSYAGEIDTKNFPKTFSELPYCAVTLGKVQFNGYLATKNEGAHGPLSTSNPGSYQMVRPTSATVPHYVFIHVIAFGKY